jgi:hypothetical protein
MTFRPDWEVPTRYAVDYVLFRDDVDDREFADAGEDAHHQGNVRSHPNKPLGSLLGLTTSAATASLTDYPETRLR